ncbi:MAG: MazG nucleotide pyrophosphohydrolase domain-containing protein [Candidatus Pacearchaeota archaeon]
MYSKEEGDFLSDIKKMTSMYEQPVNHKPTLLGVKQLENFKSVLAEEVNEVDEIIENYKKNENNLSKEDKIKILTELSDWLGDIVVYCSNEATKHGIDISKVLDIIMQSNFSKMGADGKPIKDERGKFLKGPNYWKPEPKISEFIKKQLND